MGEPEAQRCAGGSGRREPLQLSVSEEASTRDLRGVRVDTRVAPKLPRKGDNRKEKVKSYKGGVMGCCYLSCNFNSAGGWGDGCNESTPGLSTVMSSNPHHQQPFLTAVPANACPSHPLPSPTVLTPCSVAFIASYSMYLMLSDGSSAIPGLVHSWSPTSARDPGAEVFNEWYYFGSQGPCALLTGTNHLTAQSCYFREMQQRLRAEAACVYGTVSVLTHAVWMR